MPATLNIQLSTDQLYDLVRQVSPEERKKLIRRLDELAWGERFDGLLRSLDEKLEKHPISEDEVVREVEAVREANYAKNRS